MDYREVVSFTQACKLLGVQRSTLYRLMEEGKLNGFKPRGEWRFYRDEVEALCKPVPYVPGTGEMVGISSHAKEEMPAAS